jgi:lysophospholipase L1-like esterase
VAELVGEPAAVALGDAHTCAVASGAIQCWGANDRGQLGDGTTVSRPDPAPVVGLDGAPTALAAGGGQTCAVVGGRVWCWGANDAGQLGDGSRSDRSLPARVEGIADASAVAVGERHACAVASGRVVCWGDNREGQLGAADPASAGPIRVPGLEGPATAIAAGADATCAVLDGARVACWGADDFGQLGRGRGQGRGPVQVGPWDGSGIRDVDRDGRIVVVCLGDSNTERSDLRPVSWCDELGAELPAPTWSTVNRGLGGATASETSMRPALWQLEYALANDAPDVVIAAFGTNDLMQDVDPGEIVASYHRLGRRAAADGVAFLVALTPAAMPVAHRLNEPARALNELLRQAFPPEQVIDFWSGFGEGDYDDAIHLGPAGHARRARVARAALGGAADAP